jgi:hypothetical protein
MRDSVRFGLNAKECERMAASCSLAKDREAFAAMAREWRVLEGRALLEEASQSPIEGLISGDLTKR